MRFHQLTDGRIVRRYKRFLAEVELADGRVVTAHCPNTGGMTSCWQAGAPVQLSHSDNPRRKLPWTLERVDMGGGWIGVHTGRVNGVVAEGIRAGRVAALTGYVELRAEVSVELPGHPRSRIDLFLGHGSCADAWVEIKNATLLDGDVVRFPDAVTVRGRKHLDALVAMVERGQRGVMLFAVNRPEGACLAPAWDVDPGYARRLIEVSEAGVEVIAVRIRHAADGMWVDKTVSVDLHRQ